MSKKKKKKNLFEQAFDSVRNVAEDVTNGVKKTWKNLNDPNANPYNKNTLKEQQEYSKNTKDLVEQAKKEFMKNPLKKEKDKDKKETKKVVKKYNDSYEKYTDKLANEYNKTDRTMLEKVPNAILGGTATAIQGIDNTTNKILGIERNTQKTYLEKVRDEDRKNTTDPIKGAVLDISNSMGQMLPQMALGSVMKAGNVGQKTISTATNLLAFSNYGGSAYTQAKRDGFSEEKATKYGLVNGALETSLEKALGGLESVYGKSATGKLTNTIMQKAIKNKALRKTLSSGVGEFSEEYLQEWLDPIVRESLLDENNGIGIATKKDVGTITKNIIKQFFNKDNLYAGALGMVSSNLIEAPTNIARQNKLNKLGRDFDTGLTKVEQEVVDKKVEERVKEATKEGATDNKKLRDKIENQVLEDLYNGNLDIEEINNSYLGELIKSRDEKLSNASDLENVIKQLQQEQINAQENGESQETIDNISNQIKELMSQRANIDTDSIENNYQKQVNDFYNHNYLFQESINEYQRGKQEFNRDISNYSKTQQESIKEAQNKGVLDNSNKTANIVDLSSKMAEKIGLKIKYENNQTLKEQGIYKEGRTINGFNNNGEIVINMDSAKKLNTIVGHEITHSLEGTEYYDKLQSYLKEVVGDNEWNNRISKMKENYSDVKNVNFDNEVTSDLVGEYLFNNQEFINNLATNNNSLFNKVFNEIKYMYKLATAGSKEQRDLERIKKRFNDALKYAKENTKETSNKNIKKATDGTKYMITGIEGAKQIVKEHLELKEDLLDTYDFAIEVKQKGLNGKKLTNEEIRQLTGWFQDKYGKWKYEVSDDIDHAYFLDMPIKNQHYDSLGDLLSHDILFKMYPDLNNVKVVFKDMAKESLGSFVNNEKTIYLNNNLIYNSDERMRTLLHEIQHYIQHQEGFNTGTSSKKGLIRYFNRLGEIEAENTKLRRDLTSIQRKENAPESSKINAKHPFLDNYLETHPLAKFLNPIYTKIKDISERNELNVKNNKENQTKNISQNISMDEYRSRGDNRRLDEAYYENQEYIQGNSDNNNRLVDARIKELENSSFSLDKNAKQYEDLLKTNNIEYFRKDNGDVKVYMMDTNNNLVNELTVWSNSNAIKELGEKLGNQIFETATQDNQNIRIGNDINNLGTDTDYFMNHRPTESGITADNLINQDVESPMPKDMYEHPEYYFMMNEDYSKESMKALKSIKGNPNAEITIYRATIGNKINKGDWITLSKKYAEYHNQSQFDGKGNIVDKVVKAKDIQFAGDDINEWGYFPEDNANPTTNDDIRFSISKDEKNNKFVNVDTDQNIFDGIDKKDYNKIAKMYIQDYLLGKTNLSKNYKANITSQSVNKYTNPGRRQPFFNEKMRLTPELQNVLSIAEKINDNVVLPNKENSKYPQWEYYRFNFKINNNKFNGVINIGIKKDGSKNFYEINKIKSNFYNKKEPEVYQYFSTELSSGTEKTISQNDSNVNYSISNDDNTKISRLEKAREDFTKSKVEKAIQKQAYKNINIATKTAQDYLQFNNEQKRAFKDSLIDLSKKTKEELIDFGGYDEVKHIIDNYANVEYNYVDEELKTVKNVLKKTTIKVSDYLKNQITDYSDFKKESKLKINNKEGRYVDEVWQELSNMYPYYFSSDTINEADMLYELSDFMNQDINITEKYRIPDSELRTATIKVFNKLLQNSFTQYDIENLENDIRKKAENRTRQVIDNELLEKMNITIDDIATGNDISSAKYQVLDPKRLHEDVFDNKVAQKINDATVNFVNQQEAKNNRWKNVERDEIKALGIKPRSKESEAVQKYGEKQYITDKGDVYQYGDAELERDFPNVDTQQKIKHAAEVLRQKYDNYIDMINESITQMGYNPIPKRKDYFRHFYEISDKLSQWGVPFNKNDMSSDTLPTDINGLTDQFKPGKNWFASAMERTGMKTNYDAITGIDGYLENAGNLIFHTESIQRYRALSKFIRQNYGAEHGLENVDGLTDEQIQQRIKDIQDNKLSKYVAWLDEQANSLAGKKGAIDRSMERFFGRKVYTALNTLKSQVGSNMTGLNVRSAMTNFASAIQGASKTNKLAFIKGTISTVRNIVNKDGLIDKSDFLTNRFGSDTLSKKLWQKVANAGQIFMEGSDYFTANQIWRSKYYENLSYGMSEQEAIKNADDFSSRIMGDRSKGQTAEIFNSKTLGFLTQFQLEVNNQWHSMIHDNKIDVKNGNKSGAMVVFQLGQLYAMSYAFNTFMKAITGSDVMFDPIDILKDIFNPDDDEDKSLSERTFDGLGKVVNQLPLASIFTGGRIPISEAFKGATTGFKFITGQSNSYGQNYTLGDVKDDFVDSIAYWLLPTGYGQLRKTVKGLSMYDDKLPIAGSYTKSGNLRFTADESTGGILKSALFGQYSSKSAQDYIDSGFKSINESNIDEMKDLNMNSTEYKKYKKELNASGTTKADKMEYINKSNYSDELKSIMASNLLKRNIDIKDYQEYGSYAEFDFATKNPEKYQVIEQMGISFKKYQNIQSNIKAMKGNNDANGNTINGSRFNNVYNYVNSLDLSKIQKAMLIKQEYSSFTKYDNEIFNYINKQDHSIIDKATVLRKLGFNNKTLNSQIFKYVNENFDSLDKKIEKLKSLNFKIYEYNGKTYVRS